MMDIYILAYYEHGWDWDRGEDEDLLSICSSKEKAMEIATLHAGYPLNFDDDVEISISDAMSGAEYWISLYEVDSLNFDLEKHYD